MFKNFIIHSIAILIVASSASADTNVPGGNVTGTWTLAGSPYLIEGDITVPAGQTLTIEPGVVVKFQSWYKLTVNGYLQAFGTSDQRILFTSTAAGPGEPGWVGIDFIDAPNYSHLEYCTIENGKATAGTPNDRGGALYIINSNPIIKNATLRNNRVSRYGGAIYMENSNPIIENSTITDNLAGYSTGSGGGAIYCVDSNPQIVYNTIANNKVSASGGFVAAHGYGGAIYLMNSDAIIEYNLMNGNEVHVEGNIGGDAKGGAIYSNRSEPRLAGNTIFGNSVSGYGQPNEGGGIFCNRSYPTLVNNILWNDSPEEVRFDSDGSSSSIMIAYSDVQGGESGIVTNGNGTVYWQEGNINSDPLFVDAANGDFNLQDSSPCIDGGIAYYEWQGSVLLDLSPSDYNNAAPDMGAFEHEGTGGPNQTPVATASADPDHGSAPLTVQFSSNGSYDPDGTINSYSWEFNDGSTSTDANPTHTYNDTGTYISTLTVTDDKGATDIDDVTITVRDGTTIWAGDVSGTWTVTGSPYRIEGDITVPAGETLTIEPGVTVLLMSWYKLTVNGSFIAVGTESKEIVFTPVDNDLGWIGIRFVNALSISHLAHCLIEYGKASGADPDDKGGGIYIDNCSPLIEYCNISNNRADDSGGGIYLNNSNAEIRYCTISANSIKYPVFGSGGGISLYESNPMLIGNIISNNEVHISSSFTTGNGYGGGININRSDPKMEGNIIYGNIVTGTGNTRGGAMYLYYAEPDLNNNTIFGNTADDEGGGIFCYNSDPTVVNTVLWNNSPQEVFFSNLGSPSTIMVAYSDVQGGQAGIVTNSNATAYWEAGNIDADPVFVDANSGDFNLQQDSPCIDAGTAYFEWQGTVLIDLSPSEYIGAAPDMGAQESDFSVPVNQPPVAQASANPAGGQAPLTVNFSSDGSSDPDGTITSYSWDFGEGGSSSSANPTYTYNNAGTYDAILTVTDDDGAADRDTVTITADPPAGNQPPVAQASADPTSGTVPLTVNFSSSGSNDPDGTITGFQWNFGDGGTSTEADPTYTYNDAGNYDAILTVTDNESATDSDTVMITVNEVAQNEMHIEDQHVIRVQMFGNVYQGVDTVKIADQNNQPVQGATVTANYSGPNEGTMSSTTDSEGKVILKTGYAWRPHGLWCFEVTNVTKDGYVYNPDANVVTTLCEDGTSPLTAASNDDLISVYPNPFNPEVSIKFWLETESDVDIRIFNLIGQEVRIIANQKLSSGVYHYQWNGKNNEGNLLPSGIYFLRINAGKIRRVQELVFMK